MRVPKPRARMTALSMPVLISSQNNRTRSTGAALPTHPHVRNRASPAYHNARNFGQTIASETLEPRAITVSTIAGIVLP
jgi:hypothetical protein